MCLILLSPSLSVCLLLLWALDSISWVLAPVAHTRTCTLSLCMMCNNKKDEQTVSSTIQRLNLRMTVYFSFLDFDFQRDSVSIPVPEGNQDDITGHGHGHAEPRSGADLRDRLGH